MIKSTLRSIRNGALNLLDEPAVILLYHRVTNLPQDPQLLSVTPDHFEAQLKILKKDFNVLVIDEFTDLVLKGKGFPKKSAVITFDDGYADNHLEARPILEANDLQALFYIATAYIGTSYEMWWDNLERVFLTDHSIPTVLEMSIGGHPYRFATATASQRRIAYDTLHPHIKKCTPVLRDSTIGQLLEWSGLNKEGRETHRMMTFDELKVFAGSKSVVVGAHTHHHPQLSACSKQEQYHEIASSKRNLEILLEKEIKHFSYPFGGKNDYNEDSIALCKSLGFDVVCSNFPKQLHRWTSRFELPRMLVRNWSPGEFKQKMHSFFHR
jgi:peptidoglycan/xylan/chitin deacetylase (PgdA/CDA1 family)